MISIHGEARGEVVKAGQGATGRQGEGGTAVRGQERWGGKATAPLLPLSWWDRSWRTTWESAPQVDGAERWHAQAQWVPGPRPHSSRAAAPTHAWTWPQSRGFISRQVVQRIWGDKRRATAGMMLVVGVMSPRVYGIPAASRAPCYPGQGTQRMSVITIQPPSPALKRA